MPQTFPAGQSDSANHDNKEGSETSSVAHPPNDLSYGVERRLYRRTAEKTESGNMNAARQTAERLPCLETAPPIEQRYGDPMQNISRSKVLELLSRQIEISDNLNYPLTVLLMEFTCSQFGGYPVPEPMHRATAKVFLSQLRATDLVLRYGHCTLAAILPEADARGAKIVLARLKEAVLKEILSGQANADLAPVFGVSGKLAGFKTTSVALLVAAEAALVRSTAYALSRQQHDIT